MSVPQKLTRVVATFLLAVTVLVPMPSTAASAAATPVQWVWTESAYTNVFRDSRPSADSSSTLRLDTATNEYEAAQIVLRRDDAFTVDQVRFGDLTSGGQRIAADNLTSKFVDYTYLDGNSYFPGATPQRVVPVTRAAPGHFPDGLLNDPTRSVPARTTQAIWVRLFVPKATAGGMYRGSVTVDTSAGSQVVPIEVDVRAVPLPDPKDGGFTSTQWSLLFGELNSGEFEVDPVKEVYGLDRYSAGWWELVDNVAKERKAHRTNNLTVPMMRVLMDAGSRYDAATGKYVFNWQRFDQIVERFLSHGAVKRIEGFLMSGGPGYYTKWDIEIIDPSTSRPAWVDWDSAAAVHWHQQYIPALKAHLDEKGWTGMWWMHVGDEAQGDHGEQAWLGIAARIRGLWPDVRIGDAAFHEPWAARLATRTNIVIPNELNYNTGPAPYDAERAKGKELWLYNCNIPTYNYLNRFIDQPQWHQRQTMWFAYSRNMSGYLHWAFDKWQYPLNRQPGSDEYQREKGDGYIVLADPARRTIQSTVRYESQRDGIEDWEALNILGRTEPALARQLAAGLVPDADTYTPDTSYMIRMRRLMLDLAAGRAGIDVARTATATASSGVAQNAIDGSTTTAWQPTGGPGWLRLDFGRQVQLDAVRLRWSGAAPATVVVSQSADGTRWTPLTATTGLTATNSKARYLRIETGAALAAVEVSGSALATPNLAAGRSYTWSETPSAADTGLEATDGVLGDAWDDGRTTGFSYGPGQQKTVTLTMDLGAVRRLNRARVKAYEEYPAYRPDEVRVLTSVDGSRYVSRAAQYEPRGTALVWYDLEFGAAPARYVKVQFLKTGSADAEKMFLDDVELYAAPTDSSSNLALGRPYTRSTQPVAAYGDSRYESTDGKGAGSYVDGLGYGYQLAAGETKTVDVTVQLGAPRVTNQLEIAAFDDGEHDYAPDRVQALIGGVVVAEAVVPFRGWYRLSFPAMSTDRVQVRFTKTEGNFADYLFLDEIRVLGTAKPSAVESYSAPAASGAYPDGGSESVDGILAGHYTDGLSYGYDVPSGSRTVDVVLDLGTARTADWVQVRRYFDGLHDYGPSEVVVSTGTDGVNFTERGRTGTATADWYDVGFAPVSARYVRLRFTKTHGTMADHLFVDEIAVHRST